MSSSIKMLRTLTQCVLEGRGGEGGRERDSRREWERERQWERLRERRSRREWERERRSQRERQWDWERDAYGERERERERQWERLRERRSRREWERERRSQRERQWDWERDAYGEREREREREGILMSCQWHRYEGKDRRELYWHSFESWSRNEETKSEISVCCSSIKSFCITPYSQSTTPPAPRLSQFLKESNTKPLVCVRLQLGLWFFPLLSL